MKSLTRSNETSPKISKGRIAAGALATSLLVGLMAAPLPSAQAAGESASLWTYPVPEAVVMEVDAARAKAHQGLMDIPAWNATIFGPFPAAAITSQAGNITFVHINLPSTYANKSATVRMGSLSGTTWANTTLGSIKLNAFGNGTYKTSVQMPTGTRAQVYVGGKVITTTIRP